MGIEQLFILLED